MASLLYSIIWLHCFLEKGAKFDCFKVLCSIPFYLVDASDH